MRSWLVLLSFVGVVAGAACGHPASAPALHAAPPAWRGPEILASVPADTPYIFGVLEPAPLAVRARITAQAGEQFRTQLKKLASGEGRMALVAASLYAEIDGADQAHWMDALGLSADGRLVLYGMSLWPVLRVETKDPVRARAVLARAVKAGAPDLQPTTAGKAMLYTLQEGHMAVVFGVVDRELVASAMPDSELDKWMPSLTGAVKPATSLRDAPVLPSLFAKHHYLTTMVGFVDTLRALDDLTAAANGKLTPPCHDDLARMAAVMPRLVLGYRRLDEKGFVATLAIEAPRDVIAGLAKLHTPMPALQTAHLPLFAVAAAVNLDAMFGWMRDVTGRLRSHPFRCDAFDKLNHSIDDLASALDKPMPQMLQGLRGFELVIDDATVLPPSGSGHLLVAGDHIAELLRPLFAQVPQLAALQIPPDGAPVELPLAQLGVPGSFKTAHIALRPTRAALAVGDDSARRASDRAAAADAHVPLAQMFYDLPRFRERFAMLLKDSPFAGLGNVGSGLIALDVGDDGIYVDMTGTWEKH